MKNTFRHIANKVSRFAGSPYTFLIALIIVIGWALSGPAFNYSNTWQLVINTGTTVVTFLMVFLIQNTQNRDSREVQLKLDELIRATKARDTFVNLEDLTDEELSVIDQEFKLLHQKQPQNPALHKLHSKIAQEHSRRLNIRNQASRVINTLFSSRGANKK